MQLFPAFSFLWALAILNHQLYHGRFFDLAPESILNYAALFCLLRPSSLGRFALLCAMQLATFAYEMPRVSNHWLLMAITNLGILIVLVPTLLRRDRGEDQTHPYESIAPAVRVQFILIYVFATLHKLNSDFLDLGVSCASKQYAWLVGKVPLLPDGDWTGYAAIYATLLIEAGLPLMLIFKRSRVPALFLGWGFHLMLGWVQFYDFSLVGAAYYATFLPASAVDGWQNARARLPVLNGVCRWAGRISGSPFAFPVGVVVLLLLAHLPEFTDRPLRVLELRGNYTGRWIWLALYGSLGPALALAIGFGGIRFAPVPAGWWRRPALALAPVLVFLNGLSPYLGLKTEHSWAMFSNLQTEGGHWNHLFMPQSMQVFSFQDDLVRVVRSSDPYLAGDPRRDIRLVAFEMRRYLEDHPDVAITYEVRGEVREANPASSDPYLMQPQSRVLEKLFLFRPVKPAARNSCSH
jgi:hypothetical protein